MTSYDYNIKNQGAAQTGVTVLIVSFLAEMECALHSSELLSLQIVCKHLLLTWKGIRFDNMK